MQDARMLGNYVDYLAQSKGLTTIDMAKIIGCSEIQVCHFLKGLACISFQKLEMLAEALEVRFSDILTGDYNRYRTSVVHMENEFDNDINREVILDMIYDYVDVLDAVKAAEETAK